MDTPIQVPLAAQDQVPPADSEKAPRFHLPVFEGPLDLLLYLIQKDEIDIYDIPIVEITSQYEAYLEAMRDLDLDVAADFILMAATLIHIKSRMLLPAPKEEGGEPAEDPRLPLVEQLLEYQRFKEVARLLTEREEVATAQYVRAAGLGDAADGSETGLEVDLYDLVEALQSVLKRVADRRERIVFVPEISLASRINEVLERLEAHGSLLFVELFDEGMTRAHVVVTFLAILELAKQRVVRLFQEGPFHPIRVVLNA
ncbi:MAG: segregation/condensation protein A [Acidobacteriota bacterium]